MQWQTCHDMGLLCDEMLLWTVMHPGVRECQRLLSHLPRLQQNRPRRACPITEQRGVILSS